MIFINYFLENMIKTVRVRWRLEYYVDMVNNEKMQKKYFFFIKIYLIKLIFLVFVFIFIIQKYIDLMFIMNNLLKILRLN